MQIEYGAGRVRSVEGLKNETPAVLQLHFKTVLLTVDCVNVVKYLNT